MLDGFAAVMEKVEHLAGVELGAAADPVAAGGLGGRLQVVLRCFGDVVLSALGVGQAEVGHVKTRLDEVAGFSGVGENLAIDGDGAWAVAGVLGEVGDFEAEEIVVRILVGETFLDDDGLLVARVVTKEEGECGARLDGRDDAVGSGLAKEFETFFLVAADTGDADHDAEETRQAGDCKLLDADGHLCVGVVGVDLEDLIAVGTGGETLAGGGVVTVVCKRDEGGVHATGVSAGEVGVGVVGIGLDLLVAEGDGRVGERFDAVARGLRDGDVAFGGEEGVVRVVGGVEQVLVVKLAEDEGLKNIADGDGRLWVGALDGFKAGKSALVVEVIEVIVSLMDLGGEIDRVSVGSGVVELRTGRCAQQESEQSNA